MQFVIEYQQNFETNFAFWNTLLSPNDNSNILSATIYFILSTKRFDGQLI